MSYDANNNASFDADPDDFLSNINQNIGDYQISKKEDTITINIGTIYRTHKRTS